MAAANFTTAADVIFYSNDSAIVATASETTIAGAANDRDAAEPDGGDRPDSSIVIPAYNVQAYLAETVESVLHQRFAGTFEKVA